MVSLSFVGFTASRFLSQGGRVACSEQLLSQVHPFGCILSYDLGPA